MSYGISHYNRSLRLDARRRVMRRRVRDAYMRGYRDAVTVKDLFAKLLNAIKSGALKVKDVVQQKIFAKLKALALKALGLIKSGAFKAALVVAGNIDALAQKIKAGAVSAIAKLIDRVLRAIGKRKATFSATGGEDEQGNPIDYDYTEFLN